MNILLWTIQVVLAGLYVVGGGTKLFAFERFARQVASTQALPHGVWVAIGVGEVLCGLSLTLPWAFGIYLFLTPLAAACLAVEGMLFALFHGVRREWSPMVFGVVSAALAACVVYGRFTLEPLGSR